MPNIEKTKFPLNLPIVVPSEEDAKEKNPTRDKKEEEKRKQKEEDKKRHKETKG